MKKNRLRPYYYHSTCDIIAPFYDYCFGFATRLVGGEKRIRDFTIDRLDVKAQDRVLELCCGTGSLSIMASKLGALVVGIDFAQNMIVRAKQKAQENGVSAKFLLADATNLPFPDKYFDRVFVSFALHELPEEDLIKSVFSEMRRLLKKEGKGLIVDYHKPEGITKFLLMGFLSLSESKQARPLINLDIPLMLSNQGFCNILKETLGRGVLQVVSFSRK